MDIYNFIESKDIREHCRKLKHKFNTVESAYLVWQSRDTPLAERHKAWQEIIDTMPDMEWCHNGKDWGSIHRCLERYMELEDRLVEDFYKTDDTVRFEESSHTTYMDKKFASVEELLDAKRSGKSKPIYGLKAREKTFEHLFGRSFEVFKRKRRSQGPNLAEARFHKDTYELLSVIGRDGVLSEEECEFRLIFDEMWIYVPTPFQTGDLVISYDGPAVLNDWQFGSENRGYIDRMEREGDAHAMYCSITCMETGECNICYSTQFYLRLEQYKGKTAPKDRFLAALGSYYRSELNLQDLLSAYAVFKAAFDLEKLEKDMAQVYSDGILKKMGLEYLGENGGQE